MEKIKDTIFKFLRLENLMDNLTGYLEARVALIKIEIREEVVKVLSRGIILIFIIFLGSLFLLFMSLAAAQYLNMVFNSSYGGFLIVSCAYGALFALVMLLRKPIDRHFEKHLIELMKRKDH